MNLIWAIGASVVVSLISLIGVFGLFMKEKALNSILILLVGISGGALMGGAFFHLVPEALEKSSSESVFLFLIIGFIVFFIMERYLHWRHCHQEHCEIHPFSYMNLAGDGVHNFVDGLIIGASFVIDIKFGLITTAAIVLHEIPQEMGDFGVLVYGGMKRGKALFYNFLSAVTAIFGAFIGYYFSEMLGSFLSFMLPFAAGGFIYVACCDLVPEIHKQADIRRANLSVIFFIIGILMVLLVKTLH